MPSEPTPPYVVVPSKRNRMELMIVNANEQELDGFAFRTEADRTATALNTAWLAGYAACKAEQERTTE